MKIYNKIVYDKDLNIIEEDSYEYNGPVARAVSKGTGGAHLNQKNAKNAETDSVSMPANLFGRTLKYPLDLENAQGHYMIFNVLTRENQQVASDIVDLNISHDELQTYNNTFTRERFFDDSNSNPTRMIKDTIVLYMPDDVSVNYKSNYSSENEIGNLAASAAGVGDLLKGKTNLTDMGKAMGMQAAKSILGILQFATLGTSAGAYEALQRKTGLAAAPLKEMVFEGIDFRSFSYSFTMNPRNRKEALEVKDIIDAFTYHMLPEKLGTGAAMVFRVPAEFTIRYMYRGHDNNYLNHITHCALTDMKVDYGGGEKYITYRPDDTGAPPVTTVVSLTFQELELIDKRRAVTEGTHKTTVRSRGQSDTF